MCDGIYCPPEFLSRNAGIASRVTKSEEYDMTVPFLDSFLTKDNATPDYERFYYTKRYVASKSAAFMEITPQTCRLLRFKPATHSGLNLPGIPT